ncbi:MAG TPA: sigma-70 family RNA polymerase sigma factor [Casimicrobiaceae bacterium]
MEAARDIEPDRTECVPKTLGDVLYASKSKIPVSESEWVALVQSVAMRNQAALHALYERTHRLVFTLIVRITANRETAEELTLDVFHDVWRRAAQYDPAGGTVLGWIMNQARSRALDRLRFDRRKKRVDPEVDDPLAVTEPTDPSDLVAFKEKSQALRRALAVLTQDERNTIEAAFFSELTHTEVAARLNQPLGTVKTRIRSGLHKLRRALAGEACEPWI